MTLCVGCRSSRTGFSKTNIDTHTSLSRLEVRDIDRTSLIDFTYLKTDSLRIHIIEYYPPAPEDTSLHGPVKSETDIYYGSMTDIDSSTVVNEKIEETVEEDKDTNISHQEEIRTEVKQIPFYSEWQFKVILILVILVIIYFVLRRIGIF